MSQTYDAVIIGGGHNGLVAAAYLARAGLSTCVVERSEVLGGAAVSEQPWPGWRVSSASYVVSLLHPAIIADLDLAAHGYHAYLKDPTSFTATLEGPSLLLSRDREATEREIATFSQADVRGYAELDATLRRLAGEIYESLLDEEPRFDRLSAEAQRMFAGSAAEFVERYIETPILGAAVATDGIVGTFLGPRDPGTGYILAHHYAGRALGPQGAWGYVRGGMGSISAALASVARVHGAVMRTAAEVAAIRLDGEGRASGVVLRDGEEIEAGAVLSNADPVTTFERLLAPHVLEPTFRERVARWRCESPVMKVNLALGELPRFHCRPYDPHAGHYNATIHIADSIDAIQRAYAQAAAGMPSSEPMLEMFLQTPSDPSLAPPGKHLLSVFAQYYPYTRKDGSWTPAARQAAADAIVATIGKYAPNVPNAVEAMQIFTPVDLETRFGLPRGHIFHGELVPGQIFEDRFSVRTPVPGLYLCGSGTHPGGCVSGCPGWRGAQAVVKDVVLGRGR